MFLLCLSLQKENLTIYINQLKESSIFRVINSFLQVKSSYDDTRARTTTRFFLSWEQNFQCNSDFRSKNN